MCPPMLASFALATCRRGTSNQTLKAASQSPQAQTLPLTPACDDGGFTPSQTAGPFYRPNSPERTSLLEPGISGTRIVVTGQVLSSTCTPIANTLVDFWHANDRGEYDEDGETLRGRQFTDAEGRYAVETIVPGLYPGRTRHFHVRVKTPDDLGLTTQLYFPNEPLNQEDLLFQPELLMSVREGTGGKQATFNFVLDIA
ncbi:MAG: intradiol ring-cleavage dioxygenase [Leptolyngbya sp. SIO1D8]|nr:intradiol ring-cleavage dioxygenase [Leptolyngbya sp. SIO1D8]